MIYVKPHEELMNYCRYQLPTEFTSIKLGHKTAQYLNDIGNQLINRLGECLDKIPRLNKDFVAYAQRISSYLKSDSNIDKLKSDIIEYMETALKSCELNYKPPKQKKQRWRLVLKTNGFLGSAANIDISPNYVGYMLNLDFDDEDYDEDKLHEKMICTAIAACVQFLLVLIYSEAHQLSRERGRKAVTKGICIDTIRKNNELRILVDEVLHVSCEPMVILFKERLGERCLRNSTDGEWNVEGALSDLLNCSANFEDTEDHWHVYDTFADNDDELLIKVENAIKKHGFQPSELNDEDITLIKDFLDCDSLDGCEIKMFEDSSKKRFTSEVRLASVTTTKDNGEKLIALCRLWADNLIDKHVIYIDRNTTGQIPVGSSAFYM